MKKLLYLVIIIIIMSGFTSTAQCPAPSNLTYANTGVNDITLNWTENGSGTAWAVSAIPDFNVGDPLPTYYDNIASSYPYTIVAVPPGCVVFFVRTLCSTSDVSSWTVVGTAQCSVSVLNYITSLNSLSNDDYLLKNENKLQIFPNPSNKFINLKIKNNLIIQKLTIYDTLGKIILIDFSNKLEYNIENLTKGVYIIEVITKEDKIYGKFIKE